MPDAADGLFGSSVQIRELRRYLAKLADSDATVLVTGETGTGKERVAAAVHRLGRRAGGPFVAVNCAAIPETMLETELFGHERGAFTGALSAFPGRFVQADRGTLFLDEISEMSPGGQAKLLRVLEDRCVQPIGGARPRRIDVRIVAASNERLEEMVERRAFRADLFYRLAVARIELPPLRDRPEDIGPILAHFIDDQNRRQSLRVGRPDPALLALMRGYRWPGNVRELRNLVEALFIDPPPGPTLRLDDLPHCYRRLFAPQRATQEPERERLVAALRDTNWNKVEAARQLNWSRMTLYRRLAKYALTSPDGAAAKGAAPQSRQPVTE